MSKESKHDDYYVSRYSPGTRIGQWQEDYLLSLDLHTSIAAQLRKNQTFYQENFRKLRKEVESITITASRPRVYNGDMIYILNPHVEIPIDSTNEERTLAGITLSLIYTPEVFEVSGHAIPNILVGGTTHPIPTLRNTFRISKLGESEDSKSIIFYGDDITFTPLDTYLNAKLFLEGRPTNPLQVSTSRSCKEQLRISSCYNQYCRWKIQNVDIHNRKKSVPVPANADVIIQHAPSHHTLCALENWTNMMFYKECEVTVERRENIYLRAQPSNVWQICNTVQFE